MSDPTTEQEIIARYAQARRNILQARPKFRNPPPKPAVAPRRAAPAPRLIDLLPAPHQMYIWARSSPQCGPFYPASHPVMGVAFADPAGLRPATVKSEKIIEVICDRYKIRKVDLLSSRRWPHLRWPRHIAMYLARQLTKRSTPDIGRRFGGKDHTTVIHAERCVAARLANDPDFAAEVEAVRGKVMGGEPTGK